MMVFRKKNKKKINMTKDKKIITSKVFLGGTCANTTWREELIKLIKGISYFNPVVDDWTLEAQKKRKH